MRPRGMYTGEMEIVRKSDVTNIYCTMRVHRQVHLFVFIYIGIRISASINYAVRKDSLHVDCFSVQ